MMVMMMMMMINQSINQIYFSVAGNNKHNIKVKI